MSMPWSLVVAPAFVLFCVLNLIAYEEYISCWTMCIKDKQLTSVQQLYRYIFLNFL